MSNLDEVQGALHKTIESHGHAFQAAVFQEFNELNTAGETGWGPRWPEFPVSVNGRETRIDFFLNGGLADHPREPSRGTEIGRPVQVSPN